MTYLRECREVLVRKKNCHSPDGVRHEVLGDAAQHLRLRQVHQVVPPVLVGVPERARRGLVSWSRLVPEVLEVCWRRRRLRIKVTGRVAGGAHVHAIARRGQQCWAGAARCLDLGSAAARDRGRCDEGADLLHREEC